MHKITVSHHYPNRADYQLSASQCGAAALREHKGAIEARWRMGAILTAPDANLGDWAHWWNRLQYHLQRETEYRAEARRMMRRAERTTP
jgi:hypothetical protein